jgi:hypothetical protein
MDDPWGSPWADEVQPPGPAARRIVDEDRGKPNTPVKLSSLQFEEKTNSPWDDEDDGFGDWATGPTADVRSNALGFEDTRTSRNPVDRDSRERSKEDKNRAPTHSEDHASLQNVDISKLEPILMPNTSAAVQETSQGPWGTAGVESLDCATEDKVAELENGVTSLVKPSIPIKDTGPKETHQTGGFQVQSTELPAATVDLGRNLSDLSEASREPSSAPNNLSKSQEIDHEFSSPPSSISEQSHHDGVLPESPRTSDDEPNRPTLEEKISANGKERVENCDGISTEDEIAGLEPSSCSLEMSQQERGSSLEDLDIEEEEAEEKDNENDFGDFEDVNSESDDQATENDLQRLVTPPQRPVTPPQNPSSPVKTPEPKTPISQSSPSPLRILKRDYGRVVYNIDQATLEKLYPVRSVNKPSTQPSEKIFISDTIPRDSFSSTEQRKTWYRISRYGSMRKHNYGNDENYVRVSWPQAEIRTETLKTVSRWKDEDIFGGRTVPGRTSKGFSGFGWHDSNATPITIESAFAAKRDQNRISTQSIDSVADIPREWPEAAKHHSPSQSRSSLGSNRRRSVKPSSISEDVSLSSRLPVADFGWNSPYSEEQTSQSTTDLPRSPNSVPSGSVTATRSQSQVPDPSSQSAFSDLNLTSPKTSSHADNVTPMQNAILPAIFPISKSVSTDPTHMPTPQSSSFGSNIPEPKKVAGFNQPNSLPFKYPPPPPPTITTNIPFIPHDDDDWGEMVSSLDVSTRPNPVPDKSLQHRMIESHADSFSQINGSNSNPAPSGRGHKPTASVNPTFTPAPLSTSTASSSPFPQRAFSTPASANEQYKLSATPSTAISQLDPWASADFSFFDSSPAPAPISQPILKPIHIEKAAPMPPFKSKHTPAKSISALNSPVVSSPLRNGKTRLEIEQDKIVAGIVNGLPDLSYMLQR